MALYSRINYTLVCRLCLRAISSKLSQSYSRDVAKNSTLDEDVLDEFTSHLIQKKTEKWEAKKAIMVKIQNDNYDTCLDMTKQVDFDFNITSISSAKVNVLFQNAIDADDTNTILHLINQCISYKICPSLSILITVLSICSQSGDKETVMKITDLCDQLQPQVLECNSHFRHYLAEAIWIKGNITKSLEIFEKVYRENAYLRRRIRLMLKCLIGDVVANRSEAALVTITRFGETLLHDFKDFFPLTCIWQACFLSEWYTDQCTALELLENHDGLCKSVVNRIPYVVTVSLRSHRTEIVYRLLEILLKYEMKLQYSAVLFALLDYQFRQGDLHSCSEIIQWSVKNNVELPTIQHEKFLNLLLKNNVNIARISSQKSSPAKLTCTYKF